VAPLVDFVALPLRHVEGLPDGAESTNDISHDMIELHRMASDGLAEPFSEFFDAACAGEGKPDWVIADSHQFWAAAAAVKHNVPCAGILMCCAALLAPRRSSSSTVSSANEEWVKPFTTKGVSGLTVAERCSMMIKGCQVVAFRSCVELEPEDVPIVTGGSRGGKPFVTLGLLPPLPEEAGGGEVVVAKDDGGVCRWLDEQPANSVVYVALGSEVRLPVEQVQEMALGLELTGKRFLLVLRKPLGINPDADILPPGFEERTRGRGRVVIGWVSQPTILAHNAIAAFLTHCGWNSIIEALLHGNPLIILPIRGDQWPMGKLMADKEVGVQVARRGDDGSFDREAIATAVRAVTAEDGVYSTNAKKLQKIVADRECHERCIDAFIEKLRSYIK
jgi:UDP:flavonoid glycosyltransferase YjiC (YdhE family)